MTRRAGVAATAVALFACALACAPARAGSLTVRDAAGAWTVTEDPQADASDFLLKHLVNGTAPDEHFGRAGQTPFTLNAGNDPPASVRVDATRRIWMVGATVAGNQPQPVVARFLANGNADLHWGVQGQLQLTPAGIAIKPNDLLPLADGSVLVAGEVTGVVVPRAVVFHLDARGALDRQFGTGGVWQRPGEDDASTATSLSASTDGLAVVAVSVRGAKPGAELWSMTDAAPVVIQRKPADETSDGEDLRVDWVTDHWVLGNGGGATVVVPPALLASRAQSGASAASSSDPGQGGFNPFSADTASAPAANVDEGLPWTWIGLAVVAVATAIGMFAIRSRKPKTVARKPPTY